MFAYLFYGLFFLTPLILFPKSSELFEFNKIVFVYISTVLIVSAWVIRSIYSKRFIFRRTMLDIPIIIFLLSLLISTFFSIDPRTSFFGYYSRFHGGFLSYLSYCLLYWAYVSNMDAKKTRMSLYFLLGSALLVSIYGVLQHFGIDKNVWVQDVQNRIFSTLGQPNWLAAWTVGLLPITWALSLGKKSSRFIWYLLSVIFFVVLLFTKSRSGLLGFLAADIIFWIFAFLREKKKVLSSFIVLNSLFIALTLLIGTPFTTKVASPETGGTESGEIRKIVWQGAFDLWKKYPIFGTGPETFAYSYYETRPAAHNLVSEWDFLYNKAHNEYLNFAATTGTIGVSAYLLLVAVSIWQIFKISGRKQNPASEFTIHHSLLAGYTSILVTNFFGFSVVPVSLLLFLFPAFAITSIAQATSLKVLKNKLDRSQVLLLVFIAGIASYFLLGIAKYWYSDFLYARGRIYFNSERYDIAREYLVKAVKISPNEPLFWSKLAESTAALTELHPDSAHIAVSEINQAIKLSPRNLNIQRSAASVFIRLAQTDPNYLLETKKITENAVLYAPTDAKLYYDLGLTTYRLGEVEEALEVFEKTIALKPNYKNARFAKALILISQEKNNLAKAELNYILEKIDPNDTLVQEELKKLN